MRSHFLKITVVIIYLTTLLSCSRYEPKPAGNEDFIVAGYLPSWGMENVDYSIIDHLDILYFFSIAPDNEGNFYVPGGITDNISYLRGIINPGKTRLFLVVGGWYESETIFPMALDPVKRSAYLHDLVNYCTDNGIDGVDLDWEGYPQSINDDDHLALVSEMSDSLQSAGLRFSVALMLSQSDLCKKMLGKADHFNIMGYETFDENGDHMPFDMFQWYLDKYLSAGIPASRIVMGVPYFARRQYVEGDTSPLYLTYKQIVSLISPYPSVNRYGPYAFNGIDLIRQKTRYLLNGNWGGIMAWEISQDTQYSSIYSLTHAIINECGR